MFSANNLRLHVFADLSPYICTFAGCSQALTFFPSRASWADHEFYQHRRKHLWRCHECLADLTTTVEFSEHLQNLHSFAMGDMELTAAIEVAYHEVDIEMELQKCPLCLHPGFPTRRSFVKHVAEHLEEVALSTLPREVDSDSEDESQHASATDPVSTEVRLNRSDPSPRNLLQVSADEESPVLPLLASGADSSSEMGQQRRTVAETSAGQQLLRDVENIEQHLKKSIREPQNRQAFDNPFAPADWSLAQCPKCNKRFLGSPDLMRHVNTVHGGYRFSCRWMSCTKQYCRADIFARHIRDDHITDNRCGWHLCEESFHSQQELIRHVLEHTNDS